MRRYCKSLRKQIAKLRHFDGNPQRIPEKLHNSLNRKNMSKEQFSFNKGWSQVKNGDVRRCRKKLMEALGITTRMAFLNRLRGDVEPKVSEAKVIESIFAEFGINEIWGA